MANDCAHVHTVAVWTEYDETPECVARICTLCDAALPANVCVCPVTRRIVDDPQTMLCRTCGYTVVSQGHCWHVIQRATTGPHAGRVWCSRCGSDEKALRRNPLLWPLVAAVFITVSAGLASGPLVLTLLAILLVGPIVLGMVNVRAELEHVREGSR